MKNEETEPVKSPQERIAELQIGSPQTIDLLDNATAKKIAMFIAGRIPQVGGVLSFLMGFFWPTDELSLWDQIKGKVEALVSQKIAENNLAFLKRDLKGIQHSLQNYGTLTDVAQKRSALQSINTNIEAMLPRFLSGEVTSNFSCFWGIALLHLGVRKELWELYQDNANAELLRKSTLMYCKFGRVGLANIYNMQMGKLSVPYVSENEAGKVSNWTLMVDFNGENNVNYFHYAKRYRGKEWDPSTLDRDTVYCNAEIEKKWNAVDSALKTDLNGWAFDAILELEKQYTFTQKQTLDLLDTAMEDSDYALFLKKFYPANNLYNNPETSEPKQNAKTRPVIQLNPFKKGTAELGE